MEGEEIELQFQRKLYHEYMTVADLGKIDRLLGLDFLGKNETHFDVKRGTLWIKGSEVVYYHREEKEYQLVYILEPLSVQPRGYCCVPGDILSQRSCRNQRPAIVGSTVNLGYYRVQQNLNVRLNEEFQQNNKTNSTLMEHVQELVDQLDVDVTVSQRKKTKKVFGR